MWMELMRRPFAVCGALHAILAETLELQRGDIACPQCEPKNQAIKTKQLLMRLLCP
jgi:hypothetical protein